MDSLNVRPPLHEYKYGKHPIRSMTVALEPRTVLTALTQAVDSMEDRLRRTDGFVLKNAVFDLDNTLLWGDIGDAVFARLLMRGYLCGFSWTEYQQMLRENPTAALSRVVSAMKHLHYLTIEEVTMSAMASNAADIFIDGTIVRAPRPNPVMTEFIRLLRIRGYRTLVVSASNRISVRVVAREFFGIPERDAYGIEPVCDDDGLLTGNIVTPVPVFHGKVNAVRKILGDTAPLITAGDSMLDVPMLQLCHGSGLAIWAGSSAGVYPDIVNSFPASQNLFFMPRMSGTHS